LERLETIAASLWEAAISGDLPSVDRYIKVNESYRRLMGLDLRPPEREGPVTEISIHLGTFGNPPPEDVVDGEATELPALEAGDEDQ
jgi:hypothetical protein